RGGGGPRDSGAPVLGAGATPGKRFALPGARVSIRQPSLPGPIEGQVGDLALQAAELTRTRKLLEDMLVRHTGQNPEQVAADIERDTILDAQAALAYGLVDGIIPSRKNSRTTPGAGNATPDAR
ncbi:ATP-dependent Clp protease proteolytic subunit, partial [Streptomyces sp. NPDC059466]|uniref:ATP-dependent Clp protease proteolytic subunit n=1 Tax=Streptomyces sp. NPDC059466 TaxID=3346843 RepID=UPI0036AF685F